MLRAADGYYEVFPFEALENRVLAYGMNGRTRPWSLGRINVKVAHRIEVLDRESTGYWEKQGWHGTGPVNTVAKLWGVNRLGDGRIYKSVGTPTPVLEESRQSKYRPTAGTTGPRRR